MKKSILVLFLILNLVLSVGCSKKEAADESKPTDSDSKTEEKASEESKPADEDSESKSESEAKGKQPAEVDTTTGKIYAPSSEGIRPEDANKSSFNKGGTKLSSSSKTKT